MKTLRIGLVGLPNVVLAKQLQRPIDGLELVAVGDPGEAPAGLIGRRDLDAVVLASSVPAIADLVEAAAAAGKHVLLDGSPSTLGDADRVALASWKVKVLAGYLPRFTPANLEVREAIRKGAIGRLASGFYSARVSAAAVRDDAGFFDHAVQSADRLRWLSGSDPRSVMAAIGRPFDPESETDQYGIATFTLTNGATLTLESTRHAGAANSLAFDRATVIGTKGEIEFHYQRSPQIEIQGTEVPWRRRRYVDGVGHGHLEDAYRNLLTEFRDIIVEDREPSPSAADARAALEMILAANESARTGRRVTFPYKRRDRAGQVGREPLRSSADGSPVWPIRADPCGS